MSPILRTASVIITGQRGIRSSRRQLIRMWKCSLSDSAVGVIDFDFGLDQQRSCTLSNGFRAPGLPKRFD
jgi:hypothetical protein